MKEVQVVVVMNIWDVLVFRVERSRLLLCSVALPQCALFVHAEFNAIVPPATPSAWHKGGAYASCSTLGTRFEGQTARSWHAWHQTSGVCTVCGAGQDAGRYYRCRNKSQGMTALRGTLACRGGRQAVIFNPSVLGLLQTAYGRSSLVCLCVDCLWFCARNILIGTAHP